MITNFDLPHRGVETSREAAESMTETAPNLRRKVLRYIRQAGNRGATADEIGIALDLRSQTCAPRCLELRRAGLIRRGARRPTSSGRAAYVLVAVDDPGGESRPPTPRKNPPVAAGGRFSDPSHSNLKESTNG